MALPARAEYFCRVVSLENIQQALAFARNQKLSITLLGGGSNIILAGNLPGLVIQVGLSGVNIESQSENTVWVTAGAGEVWHDFVISMLDKKYYGLENLSLIPGLVGAAPVQNIGAYGVELSDCFIALEAIEIATGEAVHFSRQDCQFAYRHSIFKEAPRDSYLITSVTLELQRLPTVEISYPALRTALESRLLANNDGSDLTKELVSLELVSPELVSPELVSEVVCNIRREKLPDPDREPNVGSFFKNPVLSRAQAELLADQYEDLVMYEQGDEQVKIPAAWLIERAGWKGVNVGTCGVHSQHALVLTHSGGARGSDILLLAEQIVADIKQRFNIELEMEPRVIGT